MEVKQRAMLLGYITLPAKLEKNANVQIDIPCGYKLYLVDVPFGTGSAAIRNVPLKDRELYDILNATSIAQNPYLAPKDTDLNNMPRYNIFTPALYGLWSRDKAYGTLVCRLGSRCIWVSSKGIISIVVGQETVDAVNKGVFITNFDVVNGQPIVKTLPAVTQQESPLPSKSANVYAYLRCKEQLALVRTYKNVTAHLAGGLVDAYKARIDEREQELIDDLANIQNRTPVGISLIPKYTLVTEPIEPAVIPKQLSNPVKPTQPAPQASSQPAPVASVQPTPVAPAQPAPQVSSQPVPVAPVTTTVPTKSKSIGADPINKNYTLAPVRSFTVSTCDAIFLPLNEITDVKKPYQPLNTGLKSIPFNPLKCIPTHLTFRNIIYLNLNVVYALQDTNKGIIIGKTHSEKGSLKSCTLLQRDGTDNIKTLELSKEQVYKKQRSILNIETTTSGKATLSEGKDIPLISQDATYDINAGYIRHSYDALFTSRETSRYEYSNYGFRDINGNIKILKCDEITPAFINILTPADIAYMFNYIKRNIFDHKVTGTLPSIKIVFRKDNNYENEVLFFYATDKDTNNLPYSSGRRSIQQSKSESVQMITGAILQMGKNPRLYDALLYIAFTIAGITPTKFKSTQLYSKRIQDYLGYTPIVSDIFDTFKENKNKSALRCSFCGSFICAGRCSRTATLYSEVVPPFDINTITDYSLLECTSFYKFGISTFLHDMRVKDAIFYAPSESLLKICNSHTDTLRTIYNAQGLSKLLCLDVRKVKATTPEFERNLMAAQKRYNIVGNVLNFEGEYLDYLTQLVQKGKIRDLLNIQYPTFVSHIDNDTDIFDIPSDFNSSIYASKALSNTLLFFTLLAFHCGTKNYLSKLAKGSTSLGADTAVKLVQYFADFQGLIAYTLITEKEYPITDHALVSILTAIIDTPVAEENKYMIDMKGILFDNVECDMTELYRLLFTMVMLHCYGLDGLLKQHLDNVETLDGTIAYYESVLRNSGYVDVGFRFLNKFKESDCSCIFNKSELLLNYLPRIVAVTYSMLLTIGMNSAKLSASAWDFICNPTKDKLLRYESEYADLLPLVRI